MIDASTYCTTLTAAGMSASVRLLISIGILERCSRLAAEKVRKTTREQQWHAQPPGFFCPFFFPFFRSLDQGPMTDGVLVRGIWG